MPKKIKRESQAEQSKRFKTKVRELIDAGELNPTDADAALSRLVSESRTDDPSSAER
jgi:hypothetical protein